MPRVIDFASRTLTNSEKNFSVIERECISIFRSIRKFHCYVEGDNVKVIADHSSL